MSSAPVCVPAEPSLEEPLAQRVLRQARSGQLDEDRLLPGQDKRERDLAKKLDKLAAQAGWYTFVSAQAHAITTGKAPARRNAEIMVVLRIGNIFYPGSRVYLEHAIRITTQPETGSYSFTYGALAWGNNGFANGSAYLLSHYPDTAVSHMCWYR